MQRPLVLITGAARRVGRAIAIHLATTGHDVAFTYHNSSHDAASLVEELEQRGSRCLAIQADLTDLPATADHLAGQVAAFSPALFGIINNASIYLPDAADMPDLATRLWRIHVETPLLLARRLTDPLAAANGSIINLCDILGERPMPGYLAYCASKAALINLTRGLARELAPGIRVNGISPGVAEWPDDYPPEKREQYLKRVPLKRPGTPDDIAAAVQFLLHAPYITGQILPVDGGRSIA